MADELWAGRYRRDRLLGRGAMGEVWAALDVVLDRQVAIKSISAASTEPDDLERMAREARVAARIGHPNAVSVHDLLTVDGRPNLVMEYVDGDTLADRIRTQKRLDPRQVAALGAAVADALAEAHRLGVVHRDIKPANILITPRGVPKLADFGIARVAGDANMTATGLMIGTPAYMAPEIVQGGPAVPASDVWSLGVTLYTALEGLPPFLHDPRDEPFVVLARVLNAPVRPPSCGGELARTVTAMLDRDPSRRPTAEQVSALLRASGAPSAPETTRLPQPAREPAQRFDRPVAGAAGWTDATRSRGRAPEYAYAPRDYDQVPRGAESSGGSPLLPGVWTSDATGPPPPQRPPRRRRTSLVLVSIAAIVVLVAGGLSAFLLTRSDGTTSAGGSTPPPTTSAPSPSTSTSVSSTVSSSPPSSPQVSTPDPGAGERYYSGPGGITVIAPDGWDQDSSQTNPNVRDFLSPGTTDRAIGTFFRVGIGNPNTTTSIQAVAGDGARFLQSRKRSGLHDLDLQTPLVSTFLGFHSVLLQYTATNEDGVHRQGAELLWLDGGVTKEIVVSGPADEWQAVGDPVFQRVMQTARVMN